MTTDLDRLLLIRHFEHALLDLFAKGELNGTTHTCLGQEIVPVALAPLLGPDDRVFSNHRGHGHYLARFDDPAGLLAEIMGREGAVCDGVGGSQHILREGYLSTGVQGESLPVAVGAALHLRGSGALACAYIGDGTWGEGAVYESLNLAALWGLPLLVVVEHNGIAQTTPTELAMSGTIAARCAAFGVAHTALPADDVSEIRTVLTPLVSAVRTGSPLVVEFAVNRLGPHSKGDDTRSGVSELRDWYREMSDVAGFAEADARARDLVGSVVREVKARPLSTWGRHAVGRDA
ncbi:thiamine pyrophosphate-dependent dehydrogenase E1 component subunit alpha [Herbidospora sp. NEAU-GS84]|uniref:Thiamine pyrophosphate-dependent dehydrogenase E1 component subunit alpha n=1 Tax=Herbidospora solisilvae TaxID=2696284 RepID=A0A7C9J3C8_9ACTN|nr:thiamine pyrophosphate-dependent dehydrogenase E1 component subunit alpha [Herbidospora solisilvae]NAS23185.1 thiamine pyrophosphate-dependent dehydrogenase E1 component subunit alpha [Herbidospora solisilvae]